MTSDILYILRDALLAERDTSNPITLKSDQLVMAGTRIDRLIKTRVPGEKIDPELEALTTTLQDIFEERLEKILKAANSHPKNLSLLPNLLPWEQQIALRIIQAVTDYHNQSGVWKV